LGQIHRSFCLSEACTVYVYGQNSANSNQVCDVCNWLNDTTYSTKLAHYFVYATYKTLQLGSPTSQNPTERKKKLTLYISRATILCS